MRKYLHCFMGIVALLASASSCGKDQLTSEAEGIPMIFNSYSNRISKDTKADGSFIDGATVTNVPQNASFGVYAYRHKYDEGDTGWAVALANGNAQALFMTNQKVTNNGTVTAPEFSYTPSKYWPRKFAATGNIDPVSFIAYYPYDAAAPTTFTGLPSFTFEVNPDESLQQDLMVSDLVKDMTYETIKAQGNPYVNLRFHHMLTSVQFKAKNPDWGSATVKVNEISLLSVYSKGTLTCREAATHSSWALDNTPEKIIDFSFPLATAKTLTAQAEPVSDVLLMLPQTLTVASDNKTTALSINYTIITNTTPPRTIRQTKIVDLSTATVPSWNKNQKVIYTVTLGMSPIQFSAETTGWTVPREDDITVE